MLVLLLGIDLLEVVFDPDPDPDPEHEQEHEHEHDYEGKRAETICDLR